MQVVEPESGTIAVVPWERPGAAWSVRLLDTVQATTSGARTFFGAFPDGFVAPALRFAALAEFLAVGSTAFVLVPIVLVVIPGLLLRCLLYSATRHAVVLTTVVGSVGFSLILLLAHCLHGLMLGRHVKRSVALRLGLYTCGWDLGSRPAGVVALAVRAGIAHALRVFSSSLRAPIAGVDAALGGPLSTPSIERDRTRHLAFAASLVLILPLVVLVMGAMGWIALSTH